MSNLYKVLTSNDLDKVLESNTDRITVVGFMQEWVSICQQHKALFKQCAKEYGDCLFILIDLSHFTDDDKKKYTSELSGVIPEYRYFYNQQKIARAIGPDFAKVNNTLVVLLKQLHEALGQSDDEGDNQSSHAGQQPVAEPVAQPIVQPVAQAPDAIPVVQPGSIPQAAPPVPKIEVTNATIPRMTNQQLLMVQRQQQQQVSSLQKQLLQMQMYRNKQQEMLIRQLEMYKRMYRNKRTAEKEHEDQSSDEDSESEESE